MPRKSLTPRQRREVTIRALRGETAYSLAKEFPVSHQHISRLRDAAEAEAEEMYEDAREELEFRREVMEMTE